LSDFIASLPERVEAGVLLERALEDLAVALEGCAALGVGEGAAAARLVRSLDVPSLLILPSDQLNKLLRQLTSQAAALSKCLPHADLA
jgi:hypothetical protein